MMRLLSTFFLLQFSLLVDAQITLLDENFTSGIPSTWALLDDDGATPHTDVSQFTAAWISYESADDTSAASTSYYEPADTASDYLILPKLSLLTYSKIIWEARSVDASYPDGYLLLLSTTDSLKDSFTDTLLVIDSEFPIWKKRGLLLDTAGFVNQDVFIAFVNFTDDGFILELDDIKVFTDDNLSIPEEKNVSLEVYPNPATEFLYVKHHLTDAEFFEIYDSMGNQVMISQESQVDVSSFPSGMYVISVQTSSGRLRQKFFVD